MDIANELKKINHRWRVSSKSHFSLEGSSLIITLDDVAVSNNMQKDEAAFEAWSICLKTHLKNAINNVTIRFDKSAKMIGNRHFNRCLYRLDKFRKMYSWVNLDKEIESLIPNYSEMNLLLNFPTSRAEPATNPDSEAALERRLVEENPLGMEIIDHQMPIGVFKGNVSKGAEHIYMNSGHAALDLWGIKDDELYLYELKKAGNAPVGIISELLFYTNIFCDLRNGIISYPLDSCKGKERKFQEFKNILTRTNPLRINSVFIAPKLHSMINDEVIGAINDSQYLKDSNIEFSKYLI